VSVRVRALLCAAGLLTGCSTTQEARLRHAIETQTTGTIRLPAGVIEISSEMKLAPGAHDLEIAGDGTILKAAEKFRGRALIVADGAQRIRLHDFSVDGNRSQLASRPLEMVPPENALRNYYGNNGILADGVEGIEISTVRFSEMAGFAILISRSSHVRIARALVEDSGSRNGRMRNNLTGGILIEEATSDFEVRDSTFRRILGNGLWTHSLATSERLKDGLFTQNHFVMIGRDAIQIGHATRVKVDHNEGESIGYPEDAVDVENGGTPVAVDTAGNVDHSEYTRNHFEEINGKCFDLDGFHDSVVKDNECINRKSPRDYVYGHYGIVMNNTNPAVHSENIVIEGNLVDTTKYGALFIMGQNNRIVKNRFLHINMSQCPETKDFVCSFYNQDPKLLESGIYLGKGIARLEETRDNVVQENTITGHKMKTRCIETGPGVAASANRVERNTCEDFSTALKPE
jgi:hypothetical protein